MSRQLLMWPPLIRFAHYRPDVWGRDAEADALMDDWKLLHLCLKRHGPRSPGNGKSRRTLFCWNVRRTLVVPFNPPSGDERL